MHGAPGIEVFLRRLPGDDDAAGIGLHDLVT